MESASQKAWMAQWKEAAGALAAVREEELSRMTDREAEAAALALGELPVPPSPAPQTSGLVEQQRLFLRALRGHNP